MDILSFARVFRPQVRAMLYLHWIYSLVGAMTGVFVHIYLYRSFESVKFNAIAQAVFFAGVILGFSGVGALAASLRANIKYGYAAALAVLSGSFLLLYGTVTMLSALGFMFVNGIGLGLYWLTLHTFELVETKDSERDRYSSVLAAGDQIIDLIGPALATLLFFLSGDILGLGNYMLLFLIAPLMYLAGFLFLRHIGAYRPQPIHGDDVVHFLSDKRNICAQLYLFSSSANYSFAKIAIPIAAITFFGNEKHVGLWNTLFALLSFFAILWFSKKRHADNRVRFLLMTSLASAAIALLVALQYTLFAFLVFSLLSIMLKPLQRVSAHVIDLSTMETLGRKGGDFFPTMVFRDVAFGCWRILTLLLFVFFIDIVGEGEVAVRIGFAGLAISMVLQYVGGALIYRIR